MDDVEERLIARCRSLSEKTCGCRLQRSPDTALTASTCSEHLEQELVRARDDLVLVDAGSQHPVDLVVDRVDEPGRLVEGAISSAVLIFRASRSAWEPSVTCTPARCSASIVTRGRHVDPERLVLKSNSRSSWAIFSPSRSGSRYRRASHASARRRRGSSRREPRREQLMVAGGRSEVPQDRVRAARATPKRAFTRASPMCILVTYRMLLRSNSSTAPRSDASSAALAR